MSVAREKPSRKLEAAEKSLADSQRALRESQGENARMSTLLEVTGPIRSFLRAYAALCDLEDPRQGRRLDGSGGGSEWDRPLPHETTAEARASKNRVDSHLDEMTDAINESLNLGHPKKGDPGYTRVLKEWPVVCPRPSDHQRHVRSAAAAARGFIKDLLQDGPVEVAVIKRLAAEEGHSERTIRRQALEPRRGAGPLAVPVRRDGRVFWKLTGSEAEEVA